jgi:DNA-binding beta-propeller fold protein YncE
MTQRTRCALLPLVLAVLTGAALPGDPARAAEAVRLKPLSSAYVDAKGVGLRLPRGVAVSGSLVAVADSGNGRIVTYTVTADGLRPRSEVVVPELPFPIAVSLRASGEILVLDGRTRRIARLSAEGVFSGWLEPAGVEGPLAVRSLATGPGDSLYVLDVGGGRVLALDPGGRLLATLAIPKEARFFSDLTVDDKGDVYAVDSVGRRLWVARKGESGFAPLTAPLPDEFEFPTSIAADGEGRLYVGDENGGGVVVFGRDGSFRGRQLAMGWKEGFLRYPSDLALGPGSTLLVAERGNHRVQVFGTR